MEYIYINTRTVPPWRARIWAALQKLFGQKTEIVRISDSITQPDVHDGSIPSPDFDTLLQMLCVDSDSLKFNKRLRWIGDIEMNNGFINKYHQQSFEQAIERLNQNVDFTVSYKNNVNVGNATVSVTGKGNYAGTATKNYSITQANEKFTWGKDNYNFLNSDPVYFPSSTYRQQINNTYLNKLKMNLTNSEYQAIFEGTWYSRA